MKNTMLDRDLNSILSQMVDRRYDSLYDRLRLQAGAIFPERTCLMSVPVGKPDPIDGRIKTFTDTNLFASGQLNAPHEMIVQRCLLLFQPTVCDADRNALLANFHWEFQILEKVFDRQPVLRNSVQDSPENLVKNWGLGSWLDPDSEADHEKDTTSHLHKLGVGVCWDFTAFAKYLPSLMPFQFNLFGNSFRLAADFDFYVMLEGLRDYPVQ